MIKWVVIDLNSLNYAKIRINIIVAAVQKSKLIVVLINTLVNFEAISVHFMYMW